jgi:transposase
VQAVQLILEQEKSVTQAARDLGIPENTLHRWLSDFKQDPETAFVGSGNLKPEDKALRDMQRKIKDLEEENAILKKAMRIFANDRT